MATREVTLTSEWTQITDGTEDVMIQVISGTMYLRDSPTKPGSSDKGHSVTGSWVGITKPQQAWARAGGSNTSIVIT